jgi:hypothetical protein
MKKISVISITLFILATIILSFAFSEGAGVQSPNNTLPVHVINCPDCSNLWYCVDDSGMKFKGACDFTIECKEGSHTIYIYCNGPDGGCTALNFKCTERAITIDCIAVSANCPCSNKKKK